MKLRIASIFLILIFSFIVSGCPKLVRARKVKKEVPVYNLEDIDESIYLNYNTYKKNFVFWKTMHEELIDNLSKSRKVRIACYEKILDYLHRLKKSLPDFEKLQVELIIIKYESLKEKIKANRSKAKILNVKLHRLKREMVKKLSPAKKKVKSIFK